MRTAAITGIRTAKSASPSRGEIGTSRPLDRKHIGDTNSLANDTNSLANME
jgi:hypothetical protein